MPNPIIGNAAPPPGRRPARHAAPSDGSDATTGLDDGTARTGEIRLEELRPQETRLPETRLPETRPPETRPPETRLPENRRREISAPMAPRRPAPGDIPRPRAEAAVGLPGWDLLPPVEFVRRHRGGT